MADDPYTYPGTDTLRNRLGITDDKTLMEAERRLTLARGAEAARLTFPATADGYRALHRHLFQDLYDWAGQDRTVNIAKGGSSFAHVPYIARELDKRFADTRAGDALKGLARDEFFDRLGNHINEINAIHPFREGNGRTMRHHAAQLARDAGHPIRIASIDKTAWMDASRHGFLTGDHRPMAAVLAEAAIRRDLAPEARIGPAGIALLPQRAPPEGQRYRVTLTKAREELDRYLPAPASRRASSSCWRGYLPRSSCAANWVGLTKLEATTRSARRAASRRAADTAAAYRALMARRTPIYRELATIRVSTVGRAPSSVVRRSAGARSPALGDAATGAWLRPRPSFSARRDGGCRWAVLP